MSVAEICDLALLGIEKIIAWDVSGYHRNMQIYQAIYYTKLSTFEYQ